MKNSRVRVWLNSLSEALRAESAGLEVKIRITVTYLLIAHVKQPITAADNNQSEPKQPVDYKRERVKRQFLIQLEQFIENQEKWLFFYTSTTFYFVGRVSHHVFESILDGSDHQAVV